MVSKVPQVTIAFWVAKILATTLGETGGDALSMQFGLGYLASTLVFLAAFAATAMLQIRSDRYRPAVYWSTVVATTTVGTTASDYLDRTLGLGYVVSSAVLLTLVIVVLVVWRRTTGRIAFDPVLTRQDETFYWIAILVANTLGTALGDFTADDLGLGFGGGAIAFAAALVAVGVLYLRTGVSRPVLFWAAYVLTRPLGATLGDQLTKAPSAGGLGLDRLESSLVIAGALALTVWLTRRRAGAAR
jgi:uncharacterized membrane-anchored protein